MSSPSPLPLTVPEAARLVRPGMRVYLHGGASEPRFLFPHLAAHQGCDGAEFFGMVLPGMAEADYAAFAPAAWQRTLFPLAPQRATLAEGRSAVVPLHYSRVEAWLAEDWRPDLAFLQVAPPDAGGQFSLGPTIDFADAVIRSGARIVALVNARIAAAADGLGLPRARIAHLVEVDAPLPEVAPEPADDVARRIAAHAAALVRDGDTVQVGIGRQPAALLEALTGHRDLGFHSGVLTDQAADLIARGVITGRRKSTAAGRAVVNMAIGTRRAYDLVADPAVRLRPAAYTHSPRTIAALANFVSVSAALQVDLFGQVTVESLGPRQVSASGGFADFVRGAQLSSGGRTLILLPALAGARSRIVPALPEGTMVSAARADIDYVVTEHGVAALRGRSVDERARALIAVAAPEARDPLAAAWHDLRARLY